MPKITPCLWFDRNTEEAVRFYASIFKNAKIGAIAHYGEAGREHHGMPAGTVLSIAFELDGHEFTAINGGPIFKFNEAISFQVHCDTQEEIDYYWERLSQGGDAQAQACGWLKDKYGLSWQIVPAILGDIIGGPDKARTERVMQALLQMKKLDIEALKNA